MKKQETYTPLFEAEDTCVEKVTCVCCGKTVKKTLINQNGICIECIMNNRINSNDPLLLPNRRLFDSFMYEYSQYLKTKPKNHSLIGGAGIMFGLLGSVVASLATDSSAPNGTNSKFDFINKKIKPSSFEECNNMTVSIKDESWICPCCNNDNFGAHFCKICGVYPKFKLKD